eukprot:6077543-Amphidinium_carterae.3
MNKTRTCRRHSRACNGALASVEPGGSNIFDILIGLPVPWIIKIGFIEMAGKGRTRHEPCDSRWQSEDAGTPRCSQNGASGSPDGLDIW